MKEGLPQQLELSFHVIVDLNHCHSVVECMASFVYMVQQNWCYYPVWAIIIRESCVDVDVLWSTPFGYIGFLLLAPPNVSMC
jgi:hypothetical protein